MKKSALCLALALGSAAAPAEAQSASDKQAVRQAALDYVEALYLADASRIERSVHKDLVKRGFWRKPDEAAYGPQLTMSYEKLVDLARNWNKDGKQDTSLKQVTLFEVLDQTASAKVSASWGSDYLQLAKYDGRWRIVNILWQAHPPKAQP